MSRIAIKCPGNPKSLCVHYTLSPPIVLLSLGFLWQSWTLETQRIDSHTTSKFDADIPSIQMGDTSPKITEEL